MKHECWNGCWEGHCPRCGGWGHHKVWWKCLLEIVRLPKAFEEEKKYTKWDMDNEYARGYNEGAYEMRKEYENTN